MEKDDVILTLKSGKSELVLGIFLLTGALLTYLFAQFLMKEWHFAYPILINLYLLCGVFGLLGYFLQCINFYADGKIVCRDMFGIKRQFHKNDIKMAYSVKDEKQEADVIIVLGAATYDGQVSPVYRERLNHGIALYQQGYADKLIATGGRGGENKQSDAYAAKQYLVSQGIPEEDILTEETSVITQENLENSKVLMDEKGFL